MDTTAAVLLCLLPAQATAFLWLSPVPMLIAGARLDNGLLQGEILPTLPHPLYR